MKNFLDVYQVYFDESQVKDLDYTPYFNEKCTIFFENEVIKNLIEKNKHLNCEYFGVVSHKLRKKLSLMQTKWAHIPHLASKSKNYFTVDNFEYELKNQFPDVMSFENHIPQDTVSFANFYHPNFSKYFSYIVHKIGFDWKPTVFKDVIYCNHFVAKKDIYEKYVKEMLEPAMEVMREMPELYKDSKYQNPLPDKLKHSFGLNHWPYHSFIAERFISYFCHIHKLNVKQF